MKLVPSKAWIVLVVLSLLFSSEAFALQVLQGKEARDYMGDAKSKILNQKDYTYEILSRKHRDSMYGRFSDAVIFNAQGGNFAYPRRKDGDVIVVLDAPDGREESQATPEAWLEKISNVLEDDAREPNVFLDDSGKELGIVYVGKGTKLTPKINSVGLLEITILADSARNSDRSSHRRRS